MKNKKYKYEKKLLSFSNVKNLRLSYKKKEKKNFFKRFTIMSNKYYSSNCYIKKHIIVKKTRIEMRMSINLCFLRKIYFSENNIPRYFLDDTISNIFTINIKFIAEKIRLILRNKFNKIFKNKLNFFFLQILKKKKLSMLTREFKKC